MAQKLTAPPLTFSRPALWGLSLTGVALAAAAVAIVVWQPRALILSLALGLLALVSRGLFGRVKEMSHARAEGSSAVANAGLVVAAVVVTPLLAFAVLWLSLMLILGGIWILHMVGLS
ncbi:MAG: hypothetical protein HY775_04375 [Acidobacteria bacterium]|nr:hypothetical protein [Acidobacteriota bacterium]